MKVDHFYVKGYVVQGNDSCCFVYAAANMATCLGKIVPPLMPIIERANACHGGVIGQKRILEYFGLDMDMLESHDHGPVLAKGGLLTIFHPCFNGHCMFVAPLPSCRVFAANSFLGPPLARLASKDLERFVPARQHVYIGNQWAAKGEDAERLRALSESGLDLGWDLT
jgi:hypothetical protein